MCFCDCKDIVFINTSCYLSVISTNTLLSSGVRPGMAVSRSDAVSVTEIEVEAVHAVAVAVVYAPAESLYYHHAQTERVCISVGKSGLVLNHGIVGTAN